MHEAITGVILAGGLARRMGGVDKGLQCYQGRTLVEQVAARLAPQVDHLLISANRNRESYELLGYPVLSDQFPDFAGPLAGLHVALLNADTPLVLTVPCDSPSLPSDLASRLYAGLCENAASVAIAASYGRLHPVFCLCRREVVEALARYLAGGGRRVAQWCSEMSAATVEFPDATAFDNFNTLADLSNP